MNTKTKEAIQRHGESLLLAFPNATEKDPIALCKKLRRIEIVAHRGATAYCNGERFAVNVRNHYDFAGIEAEWERFEQYILSRVAKLLPNTDEIFVNGDCRGYALKLTEEWTSDYNMESAFKNAPKLKIYTDLGGYGILAPDLNQ